jgi:hypothetical protein
MMSMMIIMLILIKYLDKWFIKLILIASILFLSNSDLELRLLHLRLLGKHGNLFIMIRPFMFWFDFTHQ